MFNFEEVLEKLKTINENPYVSYKDVFGSPPQKYISFEAKADEIARKLNLIIETGCVMIVDYRLIERAYDYVVIVELSI